MSPFHFRLLADTVLAIHITFVAFVVLGLLLVLIGGVKEWRWIRNRWFRLGHLAAIGIVVAQAWAGIICPLTTLEMWLRAKGGGSTYNGSFIAHWMGEFLYIEAPLWAFTVAYTLFAAAVILSRLLFPPRKNSRG